MSEPRGLQINIKFEKKEKQNLSNGDKKNEKKGTIELKIGIWDYL